MDVFPENLFPADEEECLMVPIAALNQYNYCPRRCYYIYVTGEFMDNEYTVEGTYIHEKVHTESTRNTDELIELRGRLLYSKHYGLAGKADLVEVKEGEYRPVEYKKGRRGDWDNDQVQLCAQGLALEDALGVVIPEGFIFYVSSGRRQRVEFTPQLRELTMNMIQEVRELIASQKRPEARPGPRCRGCSLYPVCLPAESEQIRRLHEEGD